MNGTKKPAGPTERLGPSVVEEVRELRRQLDEKAGHDLHQLVANTRDAAAEFRRTHPAAAKKD